MIEESVHQEVHGPENPEPVGCFRHEGEGCPRCDGSGYRARAYCAGCGEPAGSVGAGTGYPVMGEKGGPMYHVGCEPGGVAALAMLYRLGA